MIFLAAGLDLRCCPNYNLIETIESINVIELYVDTQEYNLNSHPKNKKVYVQVEPFSIYPNEEYLKINQKKYDAVICHDSSPFTETIAISCLPSCSWIEPDMYNNIDITKKLFQISHMCGWKNWTIGHKVRKEIYIKQMELKSYPIICYRSSVQPHLPNINSNQFIEGNLSAKYALFETFQFSIVIENTKEKNYISEKLIDCLITKTMPIYYGCPNVHEIFDTTGWIFIENEQDVMSELGNKLKNLNESYYSKHIDFIEKNYKIAKKYTCYLTNLREAITKLPFVTG